MADGYKGVETRHWMTKFRGTLAIHQAKTVKAIPQVKEHLREAGLPSDTYTTRFSDWPLGCIVAVGELYDVKRTEELVNVLSRQEQAFGDYSPGRFGWLFRNVKKLNVPVKCRGQQGFWKLDDLTAAAVWRVLDGYTG
jgi:hypothetical protein